MTCKPMTSQENGLPRGCDLKKALSGRRSTRSARWIGLIRMKSMCTLTHTGRRDLLCRNTSIQRCQVRKQGIRIFPVQLTDLRVDTLAAFGASAERHGFLLG